MKKLLFLGLCTIALTSYAQPQLWGMTFAGGQYNKGVIFNTDGSGTNQTVQQSFLKYDGANPDYTNLIQATDGKLYGVTVYGGANDMGVLFQYDPATNIYTKKLDFAGASNGSYPQSSLTQASDGMLYGMTLQGGANDMGVLFQYNPANSTYTKKLDFDGVTNGSKPEGSLIQASDGMLYGTAGRGGLNDMGVLFQYNLTTNIYNKKLDFAGSANGSVPHGSLMQANDGMLYGMTYFGGVNSRGVLFQFDPSVSSYTKKFDFEGATNGSNPQRSLIQASDGMLYGMTEKGGVNDFGVLFQFDPSVSSYTKKLDFDGAINGSNPFGSLMQANDGTLYGMAPYGGANGRGVLFQYNPTTSIYTKKIDFAGGANGSNPLGSLIQANDGMLYGMTNLGGIYTGALNSFGVLFQYNPTTSIYTKKFDFTGETNGSNPLGSLMQASDRMFYGMTEKGGVNGFGVLFQYDPATSTYAKKLDFDGVANGSNPQGSLIQVSDGMLYGTTSKGGVNDKGVLFQFDPVTSIYTKKLDFDGAANGSYPQGSLIQLSDGMLYGTSSIGGVNDNGVLFQYDPVTSIYTKKIDFAGVTNGSYPCGALMEASDGMLYGMTVYGGTNDKGVLFQYDPGTSNYAKKIDFVGAANGSYPFAALVQASDGILYGTTHSGGTSDKGVLFQYDPGTSNYTKKIDFDGTTNGSSPEGSLVRASNGKLYGMTSKGGTNDKGVLFQFDSFNSVYTKKIDFNGTNGGSPYGSLIEIDLSTGIASISSSNSNVKLYPNPTQSDFYIELSDTKYKEYVLEILSITGQIIFRDKIIVNNEITTSHVKLKTLQNGVYIVNLISEQEKITNRIVVNK